LSPRAWRWWLDLGAEPDPQHVPSESLDRDSGLREGSYAKTDYKNNPSCPHTPQYIPETH